MSIRNRVFPLIVLTVLATGCPKSTPPAATDSTPPAAEQSTDEAQPDEANPEQVAAGFCECVIRHPANTDRAGGAACVKQLMADHGIAEPDPNTPPYTRTEGGVTQTLPRLFASDEKMEAYADASNKCLMEISKLDAQYKEKTWTDAACEEQCAPEPEAQQALCNAYCNTKE